MDVSSRVRQAEGIPDERVFAGRYEVLHVLKKRPDAQTLLATDLTHGATVVIKTAPAGSLSAAARMRLGHEAAILAQIQNGQFTPLQDHGCIDEHLYLVMPVIPGISLQARLRRGPLSVTDTLTELARSNAELELFASVASHDLQEPLRMVASYMELLKGRYQCQLDDKANRWIGFAVEGAGRMKQLISDLLEFSRVGTRGKPLVPTNANSVFNQVRQNLQQAIKESGAEVTCGPLPTVLADNTQLAQVLQHLLANAIKFRGTRPPVVRVAAQRQQDGWQFSVQDNGIGIDPQFAERIFVIFQRLHTREEYPGTGIGLALCKKVIERHGGRIWFESQPGQGTTFFFTLADREGS